MHSHWHGRAFGQDHVESKSSGSWPLGGDDEKSKIKLGASFEDSGGPVSNFKRRLKGANSGAQLGAADTMVAWQDNKRGEISSNCQTLSERSNLGELASWPLSSLGKLAEDHREELVGSDATRTNRATETTKTTSEEKKHWANFAALSKTGAHLSKRQKLISMKKRKRSKFKMFPTVVGSCFASKTKKPANANRRTIILALTTAALLSLVMNANCSPQQQQQQQQQTSPNASQDQRRSGKWTSCEELFVF